MKINEAHGYTHPELTTTLTNLAAAYYVLQQSEAALQAGRRVYHILTAHPHYGPNHARTKDYVDVLKSTCGFSLANLTGDSVLSEEKQLIYLIHLLLIFFLPN